METSVQALFLSLCFPCTYSFLFPFLRKKAEEPPAKVSCEEYFWVWQTFLEHAQAWLMCKWLWVFLVVVVCLILKFQGNRGRNKVRVALRVLQQFRLRHARRGEADVLVGYPRGH